MDEYEKQLEETMRQNLQRACDLIDARLEKEATRNTPISSEKLLKNMAAFVHFYCETANEALLSVSLHHALCHHGLVDLFYRENPGSFPMAMKSEACQKLFKIFVQQFPKNMQPLLSKGLFHLIRKYHHAVRSYRKSRKAEGHK